MDGAAIVGLAQVACRARTAIDDRRTDVGGGEVVGRVVGRVVGVADRQTVIGQVELAVLEAAQGDLVRVADGAAVGRDAADAGGDLQDGGVVAVLRREGLDEAVADNGFRLGRVE